MAKVPPTPPPRPLPRGHQHPKGPKVHRSIFASFAHHRRAIFASHARNRSHAALNYTKPLWKWNHFLVSCVTTGNTFDDTLILFASRIGGHSIRTSSVVCSERILAVVVVVIVVVVIAVHVVSVVPVVVTGAAFPVPSSFLAPLRTLLKCKRCPH